MPRPESIPPVHAVTDDQTVLRSDFITTAAQVMNALGPRGALHLRATHVVARSLFAHAARLARIQELTGCWLVVNDRVDLALAAGARGAQLTSRSIAPADARRIAGGLRLGGSVHSVDEAIEAEHGGADWLVVGHVFDTASHVGAPGRGPDFLSGVAARVNIPVLAIGGVTPARVGGLLDGGAHGVAVIRGIWNAPHAGEAASGYLSAHDAHHRERTDAL